MTVRSEGEFISGSDDESVPRAPCSAAPASFLIGFFHWRCHAHGSPRGAAAEAIAERRTFGLELGYALIRRADGHVVAEQGDITPPKPIGKGFGNALGRGMAKSSREASLSSSRAAASIASA